MRRREFLQTVIAVGAGALGQAQTQPPRPIFTEVPASVSGLTWTHDNAVSVRDVGQDSEVFRTDRPDAGQARVAFSHDGRHLLVRWDGDETGTVEIFEVLG